MRTVAVFMLLVSLAALAQAPAFHPVATNKQLMVDIIVPASDVVFKVPPGEAPEDDKQWAAVRSNGLLLAEAGNLLLLPGRTKDNGDWVKSARALIDAGAATFKAAEAKNVEALTDAGEQLLNSCENCHKKYLPK